MSICKTCANYTAKGRFPYCEYYRCIKPCKNKCKYYRFDAYLNPSASVVKGKIKK